MLSSLLLATLLTTTNPPRVPQPAVLVELGRHPRLEVEALAARVEDSGGWWLEMESSMLVVGPPPQLEQLVDGYAITQRLPALTPASLALQAHACAVEENARLPAIAMAGRFALVWAPRRFVSYPTPGSSEWLEVQPNTVLARDQSLRGPDSRAKGTPDPQIQARVAAVNPTRWFTAVQDLAAFDRSSYGAGLDLARDWLAARFTETGASVSFHTFGIPFQTTTLQVENVIATLPGAELPDEWIVVGAHYDSRTTSLNTVTNTPGAEDNASGCAAVLEMARIFSGFSQRRTMIFICFAGEEQNLLGSTAWVQKLVNEGNLGKVKLAVIMDMIGYSGDTDLDVLLETSAALSPVFNDFVSLEPDFASELRLVTSTNPFGSDHMPFINRSVPSLLTIENDWDSYAHYHKSTDIAANMTRAAEMGGAIVKINVAVLANAAGFVSAGLLADGFE